MNILRYFHNCLTLVACSSLIGFEQFLGNKWRETRMNIASTSFHARRESFDLNCNISSVYLSIFKCNLGETNDEFVTFQSFLSGDTVPNEYKREKKATDYCIHLPDVYSPPPEIELQPQFHFPNCGAYYIGQRTRTV